MKDLKRRFKGESEKVKELKSMILMINQNIQQAKTMLVQKFEEFFQKRYLIPLHVSMADDSQKAAEEIDSVQDEDVDQDALAYIRAKKKVK